MAALSQRRAGGVGRLAAYVRANPLAQKAVLSAGLHALLVGGLMVWSLASCRVRAPRDLCPFDLQAGGQPGRAGGGGAAPAADAAPAVRSEDGLEIVKKSRPRPKPIAAKPQPAKPVAPRMPTLSKNELQRLLGSAVKGVGPGSAAAGASGAGTGGGVYDPLGWYYATVRATMYEAWQQPSALAGTRGLMTRALIRVSRDGRIIRRSLDQSSGNLLMDDSAMKAVEQVQQLPALPPGFGSDYKDITIDFELTEMSLEE